jgi:hypothetical protein
VFGVLGVCLVFGGVLGFGFCSVWVLGFAFWELGLDFGLGVLGFRFWVCVGFGVKGVG